MTTQASVPTARTMRVDAGLAKRLAKDVQRRNLRPIWLAGAALAVLCLGWPFVFTNNPRSFLTGAFWLIIAVSILFAVRAMRAPATLRLIEGTFPRGGELTVEVDETGVSTTTPVAHVHIPASAITAVVVAAASVQVRVSGIAGPGVILPRELVDDEAVTILRDASARAGQR